MTEKSTLPRRLSILAGQVASAGDLADEQARGRVFERYARTRAPHTLRRQQAALNLFAEYLSGAGIQVTGQGLGSEPAAWAGVSWGLVENWLDWLLARGYAVSTVNVRLSTVKTYAKLALKAGSLSAEQYALIRAIESFSRKAARHIDEGRAREHRPTRRGRKKAAPVMLTRRQARKLKQRPDTPQGRRDGLLMCLLLDHGLRCGELAGLQVSDVDLHTEELRFYRPKVAKEQTHRFSTNTLRAVRAYFDAGDVLPLGPLLRGSRRGGRLHEAGMSEQAITARVASLGRQIGVEGLSAHDCRHFWATQAARAGTDPFALQEAGGWASLAMPRRYVEAARIANENVRLE